MTIKSNLALKPSLVTSPGNVARAAGLRLSRIEKSFGGNRVLRGIDLDIVPGSFVAVIGKSGCGKSTLLRILLGLDEPTSGRIEFHDDAGRHVEPDARIVFQEPRLLPWATVLDNVVVGLGGNGRSSRCIPTLPSAAQASGHDPVSRHYATRSRASVSISCFA